MSVILNIDTSGGNASVSLAKNGIIIECTGNDRQADHAAFLHSAIKNILQSTHVTMNELDAIAVAAGPGSYTGIRVGMASAKGFCTALDKPLIALNTLEVMAKDAVDHYQEEGPVLFCPMIDARRMEVYTAVYDRALKEVLKPCALVLDNHSYAEYASDHKLIFFGNGSLKWNGVVKLRNSVFIQNVNMPEAMATLSHDRYVSGSFADVAYSDPLYLKEFYNGT